MRVMDSQDNAATDRPTEVPVSALVASTKRLVSSAECATDELLASLR